MQLSFKFPIALLLAATASAKTVVVVQTDVMSEAVNVQGTVYVGQNKAVQTVATTTTVAPVEIASYQTTYTQTPAAVTLTANKQAETTQAAKNNPNIETKASSQDAKAAPVSTQSATPAKSATPAQSSSLQSLSSQGLSTFQQQILNEHNIKRALHKGVGSLSWSNTLAQYAQNYANAYTCPSAGTLTHSGGQYGENLASGYSTIGTVDAWYDEIKQYNYNAPGFSEATGHFTQVVWKSSTQVGCAFKDCKNAYGTYIVCEYYPRGNVVVAGDTSYWSSNVPPAK